MGRERAGHRRTRTGLIAGALLALLAACSPQAGTATQAEATSTPQAGVHPESGLAIIPVTVTADGRDHVFRSELAETQQEQARGLMFRTQLGPNEGMLFPSERPQVRSFWMRNTVIPLDIIFIGTDNRILNIHAMTTPYSEDGLPSNGPAIAVLEIPGGRAAELGIEAGDTVRW